MTKKPDLLILVVVWDVLSAFIALTGLATIAVIAFPSTTVSMWGPAIPGVIFGLSIAILILISYIIIAIIAAVGIIQNREWGRIMAIVHAALSIFAPPAGTVVGILIIVYLLRPDVEAFFKSSKGYSA